MVTSSLSGEPYSSDPDGGNARTGTTEIGICQRAGTKSKRTETTARLDTLPDDVLGLIFGQLEIDQLVRLGSAGRALSYRVSSLGLPLYLSSHRQAHLTLSPSADQWLPTSLVRYNHLIDRSLAQHQLHATQIGATWNQAVIPTLNVTPDHLLLGVGGKVVVHPLRPRVRQSSSSELHHGDTAHPSTLASGPSYQPYSTSHGHGPSRRPDTTDTHVRGGKTVHRPREYPIGKKGSGGRADIVGIVPVPSQYPTHDQDPSPSLIVAQFDGTVQRLTLPAVGASVPRVTAKYTQPAQYPKESIHTLVGNSSSSTSGSGAGGQFMVTTISGQVHVYSTKSPWIEPTSIQLSSARAWSTNLVSSHPTLPPTAFLGVQGGIDLHALIPTGLSPKPSRRRLVGPEEPILSSPYDIQLPSLDSKHHPSLLLSAWYDSHLRIHDLRTSSASPVQTFSDPYTWADGSAFYSTCFVGGDHVAGGGARHGTVALFDMRNPGKRSRGWSVFSPGGKGSPVYKLVGEGGKIWGVTEKRAFVLSFDGSGAVPNGVISPDLQEHTALANGARARVDGRHVPSGWKGRGGKWGWTVRYGKDEEEGRGARGYEHVDRGVELFDSLVMA